ncbi:MAG: methyltransferase, FkbM family domain protein [Mycobacterium sp.]|nr:methyltransferase, FkbM family domain protein [Mycobacterium sp.]
MISYAQNGEDVVLARALPTAMGFYVDVGAADPDVASVTRHFYERGWTGINIDPRPEAVLALRERRPRDVTLQAAAGSADGTTTFYLVADDPHLSTSDPAVAELLRSKGMQVTATTVDVRRLDTVLAEADPPTIDFLKVDVEGAEAEVLAGLDLARWRPTIVLVEAVRPWSQIRVDAAWRSMLEDHGYSEVLFDGLNLFFVSEECRGEIGQLAPASVLDGFTPASVQARDDELARLRDYINSLEADLERHRRYLATVQSELSKHEAAQETRELEAAEVLAAPGSSKEAADAPESRPGRPLRTAVIGSGSSAPRTLAGRLAQAVGAPHLSVRHPGDIEWAGLPAEFAMDLDWPPSELLADLLAAHRVDVVAMVETPSGGDGAPGTGTAWSGRPRALVVTDRQVTESPAATVVGLLRDLAVNPVRSAPVPAMSQAPLRLAIVGTPRVGKTWIRRVLADGFGLLELPVHRPDDLDWEALPPRAIVQLHWPRTASLQRLLAQHGVRVVSPARHPLDVLLSILVFASKEPGTANWLVGEGGDERSLVGADPNSDAFLEYATGPRARALLAVTPSWWEDERTVRVRYEDVTGDPARAFQGLAAQLELPWSEALTEAVEVNTPARLSALSGGVHVWRASAGAHAELLTPEHSRLLTAAHEQVFRRLGYSLQ